MNENEPDDKEVQRFRKEAEDVLNFAEVTPEQEKEPTDLPENADEAKNEA